MNRYLKCICIKPFVSDGNVITIRLVTVYCLIILNIVKGALQTDFQPTQGQSRQKAHKWQLLLIFCCCVCFFPHEFNQVLFAYSLGIIHPHSNVMNCQNKICFEQKDQSDLLKSSCAAKTFDSLH